MSPDQMEQLRRLGVARGISVGAGPTPGRVRNDGLDLTYLDWGGEGPTAIFLHGGALTAHTWDLACAALAPRIRCVALDLRGHGDSGWSDDYRIEASVGDVTALVDHLRTDRVHLVGMSLGGCVAGHAAVALGARVASLAFVDVAAQVVFEASENMRRFMGAIGAIASLEAIVSQALTVSPKTDPDLMAYRYRALMKPTPEGYVLKQDRREPPRFPHILGELAELADLAPRVVCPVLIARGGRSRVVTDAAAADFADRFPRGAWCVIPDAGHNVQEDSPAMLAQRLAAHILSD
jgi:pimeloyl-ACP methyl ester carboxylesterase